MEIGDPDLYFHVDGSANSLDPASHFLFPGVKNESIFDFGGQKAKVDSKIKNKKHTLSRGQFGYQDKRFSMGVCDSKQLA